MTLLRLVVLASLASGAPGAALADACRQPADSSAVAGRNRAECPPEERLKPYEPDRVRAGRAPGFVDLGNGTEIRVGGRVRLDYDVRR